MLFDNVRSPLKQRIDQTRMGADRPAIDQLEISLFSNSTGLVVHNPEPELARNHLFGEISFTDKQRNHESALKINRPKHALNRRLQFPERFQDLPENSPPSQLCSMLIDWRTRLGI